MLSKFLLVGVGGSGGKTLRAVRSTLELKLSQAGWQGELPSAWQFLHIDSPVKQDGPGFPAPMLPETDYQPLSKAGQAYSDSYLRAMSYVDAEDKDDHVRFFPHPDDVSVNPTIGAGQLRGVGRVLVLGAHDKVRNALRGKIDKLMGAQADSELRSAAGVLGVSQQIQVAPTVIVISSIAGGSGAGQFFEVAEMIKSIMPGEGWVHEIYNMLYAPDVFTEVDQELLVGNALFAMNEVMSGTWSKTMSAGSKRYAASMGAAIPDGAKDYKPGAKYNFMVGKGVFETQQDVYLAVAASLSTWMTDQFVNSRIIEFTQGNYASSMLEVNLPDRSGLKEANKDATPFTALGFGRVGLGKEKFVEYAAERLARSAIDRMLYAHTQEDPKFTQKTEEDWITFYAEKSLFEFIDEVKLNEETEQHNDIIDAIRPERGGLFAEFKGQVSAIANETLNPKTNAQSLLEWDAQLQDAFNKIIGPFLGREAVDRNEKMRQWVKIKKTEVLATTSRYVSQQGIKVTAEILHRVSDKLTTVADELRTEANLYIRYSGDLSTYIRGELGQVPDKNQSSIAADHQSVLASLEHVVDSFSYRADAALRDEVAGLIADMAKNFIDPLRTQLLGIYQGLLESLIDPKKGFSKWSEEDSTAVPNRFRPSKNEKLLIETDQYAAEFAELVKNSVSEDRRANAMRVVVNEVIMGSLAIPDLDRRNYWSFISIEREWVPVSQVAREDQLQVAQKAKFEMSIEPSDYLENAHKWMKQLGTPFANYVNENLASYLNKTKDQTEKKERREKFLAKLEEAIRDGAPLVTYNKRLLGEVHDGKASVSTVVSTFPIAKTDDIYPDVEAILKREGLLSSVGSDSFDAQSPVQHIDFFTIHQAVEPMVIDSIMQPIVSYWNKYCGEKDTRESFMQFRRPRYLWDSIPASEKPKRDILKGFFIARALGQFRTDKSLSDEVINDKGPKLSVWSGDADVWFDLPHPLFAADVVRKRQNFPGAILSTISLSIVDCNGQQSLAPLAPYKRLQKLADLEAAASPLLKWISTGQSQFAPTPDEKRAGTATDTPAVRQNAIVAFLGKEIENYKARFEKQSLPSGRDGALTRDVTWEIREQLISCLVSLKRDIENMDLESEEDED
jgi:hypothetical protein